MDHIITVELGSEAEDRLLYYLDKTENGTIISVHFELFAGKPYVVYIFSDDTLQDIRRIMREINGLT